MNAKFFLEFVKNPIKMSSMFPTGSKAGRMMAKAAKADDARIVVEIGAAHGNVTREILKIMPKKATLYAIEINKALYEELSAIQDKRLKPIHGDATQMNKLLEKHGIKKADCVISTVPLATMPKKAKKIVANVKKLTSGPFVQIQYSKTMDKFFRKNFNKIDVGFCQKNVPPVFFYICR